MIFPFEVYLYLSSKVPDSWYILKLLAMELVWWFKSLWASDSAEGGAFGWVELHSPFSFPLSKRVKVSLESVLVRSVSNFIAAHGVISK